MERLYSFPPLAVPGARVLILGSMPGEKSLLAQEYYAHPRNLFWEFAAAVCAAPVPQTYLQKTEMLRENRIALWDVCASCFRPGSLDTAICEEQANDIPGLLRELGDVRCIAFNGQKAAAVFKKHFKNWDFPGLVLPSTSPANAGISKNDKLQRWLQLRSFL